MNHVLDLFNGQSVSGYVVEIVSDGDIVSLRDQNYDVNSFNPISSGRYHRVGQPTFYAASGERTASVEAKDNRSPEDLAKFRVAVLEQGSHYVFDMTKFIAEHQETADAITGNDYSYTQAIRDKLMELGVSGVWYPSSQISDGYNLAVWSIGGVAFNPFKWK